MDVKLITRPDLSEVKELMHELEEYVNTEDVTGDGLSKRLEYLQEAAITALYGEEFWDWYNSKLPD